MFRYRSQPFKSLYILASLVSVIIRLPYWTIAYAHPAHRPRRSWSLWRSISVHLFSVYIKSMYAVGLPTPESNPTKDSANAATSGFTRIDAVPEDLVKGEIAEMAKMNNVEPVYTYGYWYGKRGTESGHSQKAAPGDRVLYFLHGAWTFFPCILASYSCNCHRRWLCCEHQLFSYQRQVSYNVPLRWARPPPRPCMADS